MTTPNPYPSGIDPVHVQIIAATASAAERRDGSVLLVARPDAIRVYLPNRPATQAARDALQRVGYQVTRATGTIQNRGLLISDWNAQALESRLDAMRGVLENLAARPHTTAAVALDRLGSVPVAELPGKAAQQHLIGQLSTGMRAWISATSGIHAPCDPRSRPSDPGCALRLSATRRAEEAIDDLATLQVRIAEFSVALYPSLRQKMSHDRARDCVLQWADLAFRLRPRIGQDTSPLLRSTNQTSRPPGSLPVVPPVTSSAPRHEKAPRHRLRVAQEFPAGDRPTPPVSRPPSAPSTTRPRGRTFPSGRAGRRR